MVLEAYLASCSLSCIGVMLFSVALQASCSPSTSPFVVVVQAPCSDSTSTLVAPVQAPFCSASKGIDGKT